MDLQDEIDDCPTMDFPLYNSYLTIHSDDEYDDVEPVECDECTTQPAAPWSILCWMCCEYFGGAKGRDKYNEDLEKEQNCWETDTVYSLTNSFCLDTSFNSEYSEW